MALKGNLRDFSITQVLNLVNVAQKTGTLVVERAQEQVFVSFNEGKLSYAHNGNSPASLTMVLYHAKKLNAAQARAINERSAGMSDKELGLLLINSNYMSQQDIISSLQAYYLNLVTRLFTWAEGLFHFDTELLPPKDRITVRIGLENLIIEGTRKMREYEQLQGEIPSLEMALKFSQRPGINLRNLSLSADEWKVISFINPKNTIRQIARATNKNDLDIRRIVFSFLQAGLVELVRPAGIQVVQPPIPPAQTVQAGQTVQTSQTVQTTLPVSTEQAGLSGQAVLSSVPVQSGLPGSTTQTEQSEQPTTQVQPRITLQQGNRTEFKSLINRIINRIRSI
jgi:hypothetical protein